MAPRPMLVAMVALTIMAVTAGAVSAQSRPPTEAERILQQTLRDIDAKAKGVKPTTNRQMAQRLQAAAELPPPIAGDLAGKWSAPCSLPDGVNPIAGAVMRDAKLWVMSGPATAPGTSTPACSSMASSTRWRVPTRASRSPKTSSARSW